MHLWTSVLCKRSNKQSVALGSPILRRAHEIPHFKRSSNLSTAIGLLVILLSIVGLIVFFSIIGIRTEMLLYIRAINALRGFFVEKDNTKENRKVQIKDFLVLPCYDDKPSYFESPLTGFFWIIFLIAVINSTLLILGLYILEINTVLGISTNSWFFPILLIAVHCSIYIAMTLCEEKRYKVKRKMPEKEQEN